MGPKRGILIVEDVKEMREMLRQVIGSIEGYQVTGVAANGWEARLEVDRNRPDLVLLDEILPGESSLDLLKDFSEMRLPVILITGLERVDQELPPAALARIQKPNWNDFERIGSFYHSKIEEALEESP